MSDGEEILEADAVEEEAEELAPSGDAELVESAAPPEATPAAAVYADLDNAPAVNGPGAADLAPVLDVPVDLIVEIGRTRMTIRETLAIGRGSVIALDRLAGEPADLLVNGRLIARGEVVAIDEEFGLRVTEVVSPEGRLAAGLG